MIEREQFMGKRMDSGEWVYGRCFKQTYNIGNDFFEEHLIVDINGREFEVDIKTVQSFLKGSQSNLTKKEPLDFCHSFRN